jgi:hypothetical protein
VPGWVSNAPVQINVGRDLHIHGCGGRAELPDDVALPRASVGPGLGFSIIRVGVALWSIVEVLCRVAATLLMLAAWVTFSALAFALWSLGRVADIVLYVEHSLGGAPRQLVYVPSFMPRAEAPMHMLGPGDNVRELEALARENDCVDSN